MKTFFFALHIDFGGIRNIGRREGLVFILFFAFLVQAPHQYHYIRDPLFFRSTTVYLTNHVKRFAIPAIYIRERKTIKRVACVSGVILRVKQSS